MPSPTSSSPAGPTARPYQERANPPMRARLRPILSLVCPLLVMAGASCAQQLEQPSLYALDIPAAPPSEAMLRDSEVLFNTLAGSILVSGDRVKQALPYYLDAARLSDDVQLLENALLVALGADDYESAVPVAEKLVRLSSAPSEQLKRNLTLLYVQAGEYDKALEMLDELVNSDSPDDPDYDTFMAVGALLALHTKDDSMVFLNELVARHPTRPSAHLVRAIFAIQRNQYDLAIESAMQAARLGADKTKTTIVEAHALFAKGETQTGLARIDRRLADSPADLRLRNYYAVKLLDNEMHERALEQYRFLNKALPDNPEVLTRLGYLKLQLDMTADAEETLGKLLQWPEHNARALYYLGAAAEQRDARDEALSFYRRIDARNPSLFLDALAARARIHTELGQSERALLVVEDARDSLEDSRLVAQTYLIQGELLEKSGRIQTALDAYTEGLDLTSVNHPSLLFARALASHKLNRFDDAEADLKRILLKNPNDAGALNALGYILADLNVRLDEAERYIKRAYELQPDNAAVIDSMGWVAFRLNDLESAERFLRRALSLSKEPEIIGHLVEVLRKKREFAAADEALNQGLGQFPDNDYLQKLRDGARAP